MNGLWTIHYFSTPQSDREKNRVSIIYLESLEERQNKNLKINVIKVVTFQITEILV